MLNSFVSVFEVLNLFLRFQETNASNEASLCFITTVSIDSLILLPRVNLSMESICASFAFITKSLNQHVRSSKTRRAPWKFDDSSFHIIVAFILPQGISAHWIYCIFFIFLVSSRLISDVVSSYLNEGQCHLWPLPIRCKNTPHDFRVIVVRSEAWLIWKPYEEGMVV